MFELCRVFLSVCVAVGAVAAPSRAPSQLVGIWGWQIPTLAGLDHDVLQFGADGSFVRVTQLASGAVLRSWGRYQAEATGADGVRIHTEVAGWVPQRVCTVVAGQGEHCQPGVPPGAMDLLGTFASPDGLRIDGAVLQRQADSPALRLAAGPVQVVYAAPAAAVPLPDLR